MYLTVQKEAGLWRLVDMADIHVQLLRQSAEDASMVDCPEGRARLVPSPVAPEEELREGEFLEDWGEFVSEDLENQFAGDVGTMLTDLDAIVTERPEENDQDGADEQHHHLEVPLDHGMSWFSTLNQARLMLDQRYVLHPGGGDFDPNPPPEQLKGVDVSERFTAYMRYEFYAVVQEWIVREVFQDQ